MAALVPAGIRLTAVGVESFRAAVGIANQATQSFTQGLQGIEAVGSGGGGLLELQRHMIQLGNDTRTTAGEIASGLPKAFGNVLASAAAATAAIVAATSALASFIATAGIFASVRFAAEVQRDFQFVRAVLQATNEEMQGLSATAEQLGSTMPVAFRDIISQLRELGRSGIAIEEIAASVGKLTASLAILARGEASPTKIAEALASGQAAFRATGGTIDDVAQSILGVANATRLSIPEVISAFNKAAPVAGIFKVPAEELGAFIALVGSAGIRGEEAGTGIRNFFLRMANPSQEAAEQMEKFNLSFFDTQGAVRPAVDVINDLRGAFGQAAIDAGKLTEATRAYALSQIFQTRTAAVAALAITQDEEAYNEFLAIIQETDPIRQAALATDNLIDRLEVLRNRASIVANVFGQGVLPGLRTFVNRIDETIGDVSDPSNQIRQSASALGQGIGALFSGSGIGQAADALEEQFGTTVANVFEAVAQGAARVREVITGEVIPAVQELFTSLGRLALGTGFNPDAVNSVSGAVVALTGHFAGLIRMSAVVIDAINDIRPAAVRMAADVGSAIGSIFSAIGQSVNILFQTFRDLANPLAELAKNLEFFQQLRAEGSADPLVKGLAAIADGAAATSGAFRSLGATGLEIQGNFEGITERTKEATDELKRMVEAESRIRQLAATTRELEQQLAALEEVQLSEEGPDVNAQILGVRLQIATNKELIQSISGTASASDALADANERIRQAYDKLTASQQATEGQFDNLLAKAREENRQKAEIATATQRLAAVYEDLGRSVARSTREIGDRIDDLVNKTNQALTKLNRDTQDRIQEVRDNLRLANQDAKEAFDFETIVRNQRTVFTQFSEDASTALTRSFDAIRRGQQDSIEDRERIRQREVQLVQDALQRQVDENVRANSEVTEDYQQALSRRNEDLQRALSRQHQIQTEQLSESFRVQNEARSRTNEDAARARQLSRELAKAKTDEERKGIQERFSEEAITISERRQIETQEANIRKQQERQLQDLKQRQEAETLQVTRSLAKQELDIRRQLARDERDFRLQQEFDLAAARIRIEEQVIARTRQLREQTDIPQSLRLEDQQTQTFRDFAAQLLGIEDVLFRIPGFDREQFLRERGAGRQEAELERQAAKRRGEIIENATEEEARIRRDAAQKLVDQELQARNTADDIRRRVGADFPALGNFLGSLPGLFGSAGAQQQGLFGSVQGRINVPANFTPAAQAQIPPELLALAIIPAAAISARFGDLSIALASLTLAIQQKAELGGVNLTIDDINLGSSIIFGDTGLQRIGNLIGTGLAQAVAPVGGQ